MVRMWVTMSFKSLIFIGFLTRITSNRPSGIPRLGVELYEAGDGGRIGHAAEYEIVFNDAVIVFHDGMPRRDLRQTGEPLQNVGEMPEGPLGLLGRRIGNLGECAEGGNIREVSVAEAAHIHRYRMPADDRPDRLQRLFWNAEARGQIVGRAMGM